MLKWFVKGAVPQLLKPPNKGFSKRDQKGPDIRVNTIAQLHADIEARVSAIREDHPDWLSRQGCDGCCRRLAEIPRITAKEWDLLKEGLMALPPERIREVGQEMAALVEQASRPIVCPLLDRAAGAAWSTPTAR